MEETLYIDIASPSVKPGQALSGEVLWALEKAPEAIRLSFGWFTEGRGSEDARIVEESVWETREASGREAFTFTVPEDGPYAFEGTLISLRWTLEATVKKGKALHRTPVHVSLFGEPVRLETVADESPRKSFSLKPNR